MKALEPGHILVFKGVQFLATGSFVCWRKSISGLGILSGMNMKSPLRSTAALSREAVTVVKGWSQLQPKHTRTSLSAGPGEVKTELGENGRGPWDNVKTRVRYSSLVSSSYRGWFGSRIRNLS